MIRIALVGQPFWSRRMVDLFREHCPEIEADFVPLSALLRPAHAKQLLKADIFLRIGYRPGGSTWRAVAFDTLWAGMRRLNPSAQAIHYWIGTDALNTLEDFRANRLRKGPVRKARKDTHWAVSPPLVEELREVGFKSNCIALPVPLKDVEAPEALPAPFTVLAYIPEGRAEFYDGPSIYACAKALPHIPFEIIGGEGTWARPSLPNLTFFGWQEDIRPFLARASVLVRLVKHDGLPGTVREAFQAGLHVIYSHPMPHVHRVPYREPAALQSALVELHRRFEARDLKPNLAGRDYAEETFDLQKCMSAYLSDCRALVEKGESPQEPSLTC